MRSLFFALTLLITPLAVGGELLKGRVIGVLDGDTITLLDQNSTSQRIRLAQIDAPEKRQAFGQRSKQSLSDLAFNREAEVQVETRDRYGRLVGKVLIGGIDINLEQILLGMAWVYRQYAKDPAYFKAESQAREAKKGLWVDSDPTPPWLFRHPKKPQDGTESMKDERSVAQKRQSKKHINENP